MAKKYQIRWYDTVKEWEHNTHEENALSKTDLIKRLRAILITCENPVIVIKVWSMG